MTTFQRVLSAICLAVGIILLVVFSWLISGNRSYHKGWNEAIASIKPDTVWRDSTIYVDKPVPVIHYKDTGRTVYVPVPIKDTTGHPDTTLVPLNPEVKYYAAADSTYELEVSGIQPQLDWIKVHQKTAYITKVVTDYKYPSLIISPALNVEILPRSFFAGAGIVADYWTGRFQISAEVGYGINNILSSPTQNSDIETELKMLGSGVGFYGKLGAKFNIIRK